LENILLWCFDDSAVVVEAKDIDSRQTSLCRQHGAEFRFELPYKVGEPRVSHSGTEFDIGEALA
jgi:hypothetical protein